MDFDIGFAGIASKDGLVCLAVFDKDKNVLRNTTHRSKISAQSCFKRSYGRENCEKPQWYDKKVEYSSKPLVTLLIDGISYCAWDKLNKNLRWSDEKKKKR